MANNFDGLGVGFEVEDNDSTKNVDNLTSSFNDLWGTLKRVGSAVPRVGAGMTRGLRRLGASGAKSVGMVSTAVGALVDKAMDPQLDSAYASMYAGFNKEFSALTAGMKETEGDLTRSRKRIGGIAQGMGEDMGQAAQNWLAFEQRGIELDKVLGTQGLTKTMQGMIKVTSVFGLEGRQWANIAASLKNSYGMTEEAIGGLGDKIVAVGREFNMGREAIQSWPNIMQVLNKELADFGQEITPDKLDKLTTSLVQLGGGFKQALGIDPAEAMELATQSFSTLAAERKNIINMARGMGGEFGEMAKGMMEAGDDVESIFKQMIEGDPLKFMDMLRELGKEAEKRGGQTGIAFQRLNAVINNTLGPDISFAVQGNWDQVSETMARIPQVLEGSRGTMRDIAKEHWKSSLTAGDAWEMMVNNMKAKVFKLSNKEIRSWQKNMRSGFKDSFATVKAFADDKGPLGELTRKLLAVQRVGFSAFLPSLGALGPMIGGITSEALPMLTALGSMGVRFSDLGKLAGVGGGAYLLFKTLTEGPDAVIDKFDQMKDSFVDIATTKIFTGKKNAGIRKFITDLNDDIENIGLFETFKKNIMKVPWEDLWDKAWEKISDFSDFAGEKIQEIPWEEIARTAVEWFGKGVQAVGAGIWNAFFGGEDGKKEAGDVATDILSDAVTGAMKVLWKIAKGSAKGLWDSIFDPDSLKNTFENILKVSTGGFAALMILSKKFRRKMGSGLWSFMKKGFSKRGGKGAGGGVADAYGSGLAWMIPGLGPDKDAMKRQMRPMVPQPPPENFRWGRGGIKPPPVPKLGRAGGDAYRKQMEAMRGLSTGVMMPVKGMGDLEMVMGPAGAVPKGGLEAGKRKGFFGRVRDRAKSGGAKLKGGIKRSVGGARNMLKGVGGFGGVMAMGGLFEGIQQLSERSENIAKISMSNILSEEEKFLLKTEESFLGVANTIDGMFMGLPSMIGSALGISQDDVTGFYHHMVGSFESGINNVVELFKFFGRTAENVYDNMSARAEGFIADAVHGFKTFKNDAVSVFYSVVEAVHKQFAGLSGKLMYPFEWLSFKLKGWMADIVETIFGKPGESSLITDTLKKVLGEDTVSGMQMMAKGMRKAQDKYLGGEKDFDTAYWKNEDKRQKRISDSYGEKQKEIARDQEQIDKEHDAFMKSVEDRKRKTSSDVIAKDYNDTLGQMNQYADERAKEAQKNADKAMMARSNMAAEERRKNFEVIDGEAENQKKKKKKRRRKDEIEDTILGKKGEKEKASSVMSNEERTKTAMSPGDVSKILDENRKQIAQLTTAVAAATSAMAESNKRPIDVRVTSVMDGRKVGEGVERYNRKSAKGM